MNETTWTPKLLRRLTPDERAFVLCVAAMPAPLWSPLPGPQSTAFISKADIIGYGGAAGGGKTDLALGKVLRQHSRAIVYRKNGTEHTAFVDRMEEILGSRDGFNSKDGIWKIKINGRKVQMELGSMPNMGDERKYRGRPHDLKVFDEVAEIPESQVRFLMGWTRTTQVGQQCQILFCFNPPTTIEGRWVIEFFAPWLKKNHPNPARPGELRWFAAVNGKDIEVENSERFVIINGKPCYKFNAKKFKATEIIIPLSRTFIPARVTDNPYYAEGTYMAQLQALPEPLRSQMLNGDFMAGMTDDVWQVIPTAWIERAMAKWTELDPKPAMDSLGIDVARGGADNTIIARRHGMWFDKPLVYPGTETPDGPLVAGLSIAANRDHAPMHIDVIGVGASPYDFLNEARQQVIGVDVRESSVGTDRSGRLRFKNQRSELAWRMREALDPANNTGIVLPPDDRLKADLAAFTWKPVGPIIYVHSREEILDKIHRSPDWAAAYFLALIDTPKRALIDGVLNANKADYDPYAGLTRRDNR